MVDEFRENTATVLGRRVIAALAARDFDTLATLFDDDYVEAIQRPGEAPVPRGEMLRGIRMLVESAGGTVTIEPVATLGDHLQLQHTRISVASPGGETHVIDYASVMEATTRDQLLRTEAFEPDRLDDAVARLSELGAASSVEGTLALDHEAFARLEALRDAR